MQRVLILLGLLAVLAVTSGCAPESGSSGEYYLPEGSAGNGQKAFVSLECTACHRVQGHDLPAPQTNGPMMVILGGGVTKVRTYGELVTSIINPSHRLARGFPTEEVSEDEQSRMTVYNELMTVQQLIDLVAFLQAEYDIIPRPGYRYPVYTYKED
jgi:hypothetical protein